MAPHVMLARGWERQLDRYRNGLFYDESAPLTAARYRAWLSEQAISYVALPDAPLDYSGERRGAAAGGAGAAGGGRYLREVWRSRALAPVRGRSAPGRWPQRRSAADASRRRLASRSPRRAPGRLSGARALHPLLGARARARLRARSARAAGREVQASRAGQPARRDRLLARRACSTTAPAAAEHRLGFAAMVARVRVLQARLLPQGWLDAAAPGRAVRGCVPRLPRSCAGSSRATPTRRSRTRAT